MKINTLSVITIAALAAFASCSKDNLSQQQELTQDGPFEVTIRGELGEFAPSTKSTAESCVRMKWTEGDVVWAYNSNGDTLSKLTVSLEDGNNYVAILKGTLKQAPSNGKLLLIHSTLLSKTKQPELTSSALTIDMSNQAANETPFVAYATVDGVTNNAQYASDGLTTKFSFATSVLKVNATGITKNAELSYASISNIETKCKLTIDDGTFTITGETSGKITKNLSGYASLKRASFYVGVPKFNDATKKRILIVYAGEKYYPYSSVMTKGYEANNYINYVYEAAYYIDDDNVNQGIGTYIEGTGVVWAPVNCGYEAAKGTYKGYPYGKLYQWGRKDGQGYDSNDATTPTITTYWNEANGNEDSNTFYKSCDSGCTFSNDWIHNGSNYYWNSATGDNGPDKTTAVTPKKTDYDPCPTGWRVPTYAELNALIDGSSETGNSGWDSSNNGYWFNGTKTPSSGNGLFLPAAGFRDTSGNVYHRETSGSYWSSSVSSTNGVRLYFSSSKAYISNHYRANGFSVRCVHE